MARSALPDGERIAVCAAIEGIAAAAATTAAVLDSRDAAIDSDTIDASFACLGNVNTSVDNLDTAVGDTNAALTEIQTQLGSLQEQLDDVQQEVMEVNQLLRTPLGLREGFPSTETIQ